MAQMTLAFELMVDGRTEESIAEFEQVRAILARPEVEPPRAFVQRLREWLGVAYLRLGEQENCIDRHTSDSCLMPILGGGVHTRTRGATAAIEQFTQALSDDPNNLRYRWLLNLAARGGCGSGVILVTGSG